MQHSVYISPRDYETVLPCPCPTPPARPIRWISIYLIFWLFIRKIYREFLSLREEPWTIIDLTTLAYWGSSQSIKYFSPLSKYFKFWQTFLLIRLCQTFASRKFQEFLHFLSWADIWDVFCSRGYEWINIRQSSSSVQQSQLYQSMMIENTRPNSCYIVSFFQKLIYPVVDKYR